MSNLLQPSFWSDALERAVKTFAQSTVAFIGADAIDVLSLDWGDTLSVGAGAALLSLLTSVASSGVGDKGTASLVSGE